MISISDKFNLGQDTTRIKEVADADRQGTTVSALLERLFNTNDSRRREIQILADEVGLGKTFVALGVGFSILEAMKLQVAPGDLRGCYQKVLVVTPGNRSLFEKWRREVGEFVKRCVLVEHRAAVGTWFRQASVDRLDELVSELRRPGASAKVIVTTMGVCSGKFKHYDVKRRQLLHVLFRYWGNRFDVASRWKLLKGAPQGWPSNPDRLCDFDERERAQCLFSEDELFSCLEQVDRQDEAVESLLERCREIAEDYRRDRDELFRKLERKLPDIYRQIMAGLITQDLPLVIVDEAHNWKNGPTGGSNGYQSFVETIGCRARRALLLTATPFQLRPQEMLEILKVGDHLSPCATQAASAIRVEQLKKLRQDEIEPVLRWASSCSARLSKEWARLDRSATTGMLDDVWKSADLVGARKGLHTRSRVGGRLRSLSDIDSIASAAAGRVVPSLQTFYNEALQLFALNSELSRALGELVVRHRRGAEHRLFRVGNEYLGSAIALTARPDRQVLHQAPGVDVRGEGELPHYILMRCVAEMKAGKGRASLGSALTGCYSTLVGSSEGKAVRDRLSKSEVGGAYLGLLETMVDKGRDEAHPKVKCVVDAAVSNWRRGEKTLIFCFRTNTASRVRDIIDSRIRAELATLRRNCLGGEKALTALKSRLTGRGRDLVVIGLDRVLLSAMWSERLRRQLGRDWLPDDLHLADNELEPLAELSLRSRVDLLGERVDRVFLTRATELLLARRLLRTARPTGDLLRILKSVSDEGWVSQPYGLSTEHDADSEGAESAHVDERGVNSRYHLGGSLTFGNPAEVAAELRARRAAALKTKQIPIIDAYAGGPNLWLGVSPWSAWQARDTADSSNRSLMAVHEHLWALVLDQPEGRHDWDSRRLAVQALRRVVLRESVLLRLLPSKVERDESTWGELLVDAFHRPSEGRSESMLDRIGVFLEDVVASSGTFTEAGSARAAFYDATKLRDQQFVALVDGSSKSRERVFSGFNTPLLPEVLVCTSVGQEGIDLHRHCRHVVHFDLAWNPAVLEQRTGRVDRIGSQTFRERAVKTRLEETFLEVGVPYLAGTYDERMYEELRLRAQTFEVLTGGDVAADDTDQEPSHETEGTERGLSFVPLPASMLEDLRVRLHVWSPKREVQ